MTRAICIRYFIAQGHRWRAIGHQREQRTCVNGWEVYMAEDDVEIVAIEDLELRDGGRLMAVLLAGQRMRLSLRDRKSVV